MIVVLPFNNLTGDASQEYISDGITEEISEQLGNEEPHQLGVIGRTSAMSYKYSHRNIREIGQELGVDYVLEGSVRRDGNQVRVTAQLVQVSNQAHVWAANYDEDFQNLLQLESTLAADIARRVGVSIAIGQEKEGLKAHIPDAAAHEAYLRGRYYWYQRTLEGWKIGEEQFRIAIQKDPEYAAAYAGLAECRISKIEAQAAALKATSLDPTSAEAFTALGWVELYRYLDFAAAGAAFRKATALAPNYAQAHYSYAGYLAINRPDERIAEIKQSIRLDPLSAVFNSGLASALLDAGRVDEALQQLKVLDAINPRFARAHSVLGDIYMQQGKYRQAIAEYRTYAKLGGDPSLGAIGYAYARSGDRKHALQIRAQLYDLDKAGEDPAFELAMVEVGLGDYQKAIDWLQKSYNAHDDNLLSLLTDRTLDPLRTDPRFKDIVRRMNFPQ